MEDDFDIGSANPAVGGIDIGLVSPAADGFDFGTGNPATDLAMIRHRDKQTPLPEILVCAYGGK